jgi:hypothetical protein
VSYAYGMGDAASSVAAFAQNPDALYAAALGTISNTPEMKALLSPVGQQILGIGEQFISSSGIGASIEQMGQLILGELVDLLPKEVTDLVNSVEGAVSSIAVEAEANPVIGFAVGTVLEIFQEYESSVSAQEASDADICSKILSRPIRGSGPAPTYAPYPSDIFNPEPYWIPKSSWVSAPFSGYPPIVGYPLMPGTGLGTVLAAITEDMHSDLAIRSPLTWVLGMGTTSGGPPTIANSGGVIGAGDQQTLYDSNLHHAPDVMRLSLSTGYTPYSLPLRYRLNQSALASEQGVGLSDAQRRAFQLLRLAIGSSNSDHGKSLMPLYMDLLDGVWGKQLTGGYAYFLLTMVVNFDKGGIVSLAESETAGLAPFGVVVCQDSQWLPFINAIDNMVHAWRAAKVKLAAAVAAKARPTVSAALLKNVFLAKPPAPPVPLLAAPTPKTPAVVAVALGAAAIGSVFVAVKAIQKHRAQRAS